MQKSIFSTITKTVICVTLLALCFWFLSKAGVQPLWAAIGIVFLKGLIRFIFRLTVMLVSIAIAIVIFLFIALLTCI